MKFHSFSFTPIINSTNEFRNAFLRTIRQIIRESVRNMAVPLSRPVSVQGRGTLPHNKSSIGSVAAGNNNSNSSRQTKVVTISYTSKQPISSNSKTPV